jgi:hypothetical protein
MANNIKQIKAAIEANLAKIRDAYYAALNSDSSPEGVETARANYATALKSAQLNARTLLNDQTKPDIVDLGIWNVMAKIGMANPSVILAEEVKESKGKNEDYPGQRDVCIELLNAYMRTLRELLDNTGYGKALYMTELGDFINGNDGYTAFGKNGPVDCWLQCEILKTLRSQPGYHGEYDPGLFESCRSWLNRNKPLIYIAVQEPHLPFQLPTWPEEAIPGKIGKSPPEIKPEIFDEQEKKIKEILKRIKDNPSGNQPHPECADLYKEAVRWASERFNFALKLIDICKRLKELWKLLTAAGCFEFLHLDVLFARRKIGQFGDLEEFRQWWWKWFIDPRNEPDLKPYVDVLSSAQYEDLKNYLVYRGKPDRYVVANRNYEEWVNSPESTRSLVPPIWKQAFALFDNTDFDDDTAFRYFCGTVYRGDYVNAKIDFRWTLEDFDIMHTALNDLLNYYVEGDV